MKMLHPELNGYKPFTTPNTEGCKFYIKPEAVEDKSVFEVVADICRGFDSDGDFCGSVLYDDSKFEYLGDGSFSRVVAHPHDSSKVIKMMLRYNSDSTCYQYLRLCKTKAIDFPWCPEVYDMGRIKCITKTKYATYKRKGTYRVVDIAYVVLDRLNVVHSGWDESDDIACIKSEFYPIFREYFPFAKIDVRGANVLVDDDGKNVLTDPVWNGSGNDLPEQYLPWVSKQPEPKRMDINLLKENITHARVW